MKLVGVIAVAALYWFPLRRWFSHWGTTPEEAERVMLGDALISKPTDTSTGAVTVNARPEHIWPWLVQMGTGRGGLYSYDWLDRALALSMDAHSMQWALWWLGMRIMEPVAFIMTSRFMLGVKSRAEALRASASSSAIAARAAPTTGVGAR